MRTTPVTVIGLGQMGSAIARRFAAKGHPTTVWNRSSSKIAPLLEEGATAAATASEATRASTLVVVCLRDHAAVDEVLAPIGDGASGKVVVDLTSGSPDQARRTERWAREHGADYLAGGIMADPSDLGSDHARISISGSSAAFNSHRETLSELGDVTYFGQDPGAASVEFMAQVAIGYELLIGFLHTLALVRAEGADVAGFAERVADSMASGYPSLLTAIGNAVRDREYVPDLGPLSVQTPLMTDLIEHRESLGIDNVRMREIKQLMERRIADGHGHEGISSLIELLRN